VTGTDISCLCGAVQVRLTEEPTLQFYCHCDDCQAVSGGAYVSLCLFPAHALSLIQGETTILKLRLLPRERCSVCGTQMFVKVPGEDMYVVKGNLLPREMHRPAFHMQCRYAVAPVKDDLPHYKGVPACFGGNDDTVAW
jgi:hypothetical protein